MIRNVAGYVGCQKLRDFMPPVGWRLVKMATLDEGALGKLPLAAIMHNRAARQLAVVIRGTLTGWEWGNANFLYNQASSGSNLAVPSHTCLPCHATTCHLDPLHTLWLRFTAIAIEEECW